MTRTKTDGSVLLRLEIECRDEQVASALDSALMPDNRYFPKDQSFKASRRGNVLSFTVGSPRVRPAVTTVKSIIADARLFAEVWSQTKEQVHGRDEGTRAACNDYLTGRRGSGPQSGR